MSKKQKNNIFIVYPYFWIYIMDPLTFDEKTQKHEDEITRRLIWCLKNKFLPASENLHRAPGDDSNFFHGVPPWLPDGSVNRDGVFAQGQTSVENKLAILCRDDGKSGWNCYSCKEWVPIAPRKYVGKEEPWNWWFCMKCRETKCKPSKDELKRKREAEENHKITTWFTKHCT